MRAISLQPVPWDYPSAGIDFTVRVRKCTLPVLDIRDKRQTGQVPAPRELTPCGGEGEESPHPPQLFPHGEMRTQVARGGEDSTKADCFLGPFGRDPRNSEIGSVM